MTSFRKLVATEKAKTRAKFPRLHSAHEAYGLMKEEFEEFWEEIRKKRTRHNFKAMRHELAQLVSLCECFDEDLPNS